MPYLKIAQDQSVTMTIKAVGQEYSRHWVGNQYIECQGEGCGLCTAGMSVSRARNLEVLVGDQAKTWTCPGGAFTALVGLAGSSEGLVGREVTVKRVVEQNRTRYKSCLTGERSEETPAPEAMAFGQDVSGFLSILDAAIKDPRFAAILEGLLSPGQEDLPY